MSFLIEAKNIKVVRDKNIILNDISLTIENDDFITIIGPNGAGKSMLLKCLMNFYKPNSGKISHKKNLSIGYVPQRLENNRQFPISVEKFLQLNQKIDQNKLLQIIDEVKIANILQKQLFVLSGGEMQRVLLAFALLKNPEILILDEPAQNLDISGQLAFYEIIENIYKNSKIAIIMVSHDLHLVMASSKKVICLFHHICCEGTPQEITKDPEFTKIFGDKMNNMMAIYNHSHNHIHDFCKGENA